MATGPHALNIILLVIIIMISVQSGQNGIDIHFYIKSIITYGQF